MKLLIRLSDFFRFQVLAITLSIHYSTSTKIGIVHWNDVNGQLQRYYPNTFTKSSPPLANCKAGDYTTSCIGGLENIIHIANQRFPAGVDRIFKLNAGNFVGGDNGWLSVVRYSEFGNLAYRYISAQTFGINDFGSGVAKTVDYYFAGQKHPPRNQPCVLSNLICPPPPASEPEYYICSNIKTIHKLTDGIALLGFINPNATKLSSPGRLEFADIVTSLRKVVANNSKYSTFIAMGDGSFEIAQNILDSIPEIKLVIYSQGHGDPKEISGECPHHHGRNQYIATAGRYGSTVGRLVLDIDEQGEIVSTAGSSLVVPLGSGQTIHEIGSLNNRVEVANVSVGKTLFNLEGGETCWRGECGLGNLVADSMVHCALNSDVGKALTTPILALLPSASIYHSVLGPNNITTVETYKWLRNRNPLHLVKINGSHLLKVFQAGASGLTANTSGPVDWGQFLQVSRGLAVYYNTEGGSPLAYRVRSVDQEDSRIVMRDTQPDKEYSLVIPSSIKEGRNVFEFATSFWKPHGNRNAETVIGLDSDCLQNYIRAMGAVQFLFEQRIWINEKGGIEDIDKDPGSGSTFLRSSVTVTLIVIAVIIFRLFQD